MGVFKQQVPGAASLSSLWYFKGARGSLQAFAGVHIPLKCQSGSSSSSKSLTSSQHQTKGNLCTIETSLHSARAAASRRLDEATGLLNLEKLLRQFLISKDTLSVRMLDDSRDPTPLLKEIRDDKTATIIVHANASMSHTILQK
ncbi:hypothetical protein DV515_00013983, partial [Chloebia gouldiae]